MAVRQLQAVVHNLRGLVAAHGCRRLSDPELLCRFLTGERELAFAALVERHGPMVLRVCRRALGQAQDAEDTCQAVFLVLARKAASVRKRESLASWLHGVAHRLARKARSRQLRRRRPESLAAEPA